MIEYFYSKDFNIINKLNYINSYIYRNLNIDNQLKVIHFINACIKFDKNERYDAPKLLKFMDLFDSFR